MGHSLRRRTSERAGASLRDRAGGRRQQDLDLDLL